MRIGHTISWPDERRYDETKAKYQSLLARTSDWAAQWLVLLLASLLIALLACVVAIASSLLSSYKLGHCRGIWYASFSVCCMGEKSCESWIDWPVQFPIFILASLAFGMLAFVIVSLYPNTAMSGIPELKGYFQGFTMPDLFGNGPLVTKAVALTFAIASGLWIGLEGPLIHLAALATNLFIQQLRPNISLARNRDLVMASCAAGLCLAFNAPIGGILYAFEVFKITDRSVLWNGFVCSMVASFIYESVDPMRTGKQMFFNVSYDRVWHGVELVFFAILAVLAALLGSFIAVANASYTKWRREHAFKTASPVVQVLLVSLVTAIVTVPVDLLKRGHQELLRDLFQECKIYHTSGLCDADRGLLAWRLLYCLIASVFLTVVTYGIAIPSGIMLPVLLTGAILGRVFGIGMQHFANSWESILNQSFCPAESACITPGVYALVGAAAALTGATKLTVSSVVVVFEMTGALSYIIPIMIGVMIAKWVSDGLRVPSIYDQWMHLEGYPLPPAKTGRPIPNLMGYDVMKPFAQLSVAHLSDSTTQLRKLLKRNVFGFPVLDEANHLVGFISHKSLSRALSAESQEDDLNVVDLYDHLDAAELHYLSSNVPLVTLSHYMQSLGMHTLLFVDKSELQGLITQADLIRVLNSRELPPLLHREISYRQSLDRELPDL